MTGNQLIAELADLGWLERDLDVVVDGGDVTTVELRQYGSWRYLRLSTRRRS